MVNAQTVWRKVGGQTDLVTEGVAGQSEGCSSKPNISSRPIGPIIAIQVCRKLDVICRREPGNPVECNLPVTPIELDGPKSGPQLIHLLVGQVKFAAVVAEFRTAAQEID